MLFFQQLWDGVRYAWSDYKKALVGSVLVVIPLVNVYVLGFLLVSFQQVRKSMVLPSWGEWQRLLKLGVFCFGVILVYVLGLLLMSFLVSMLGHYSRVFFLLLLVVMVLLMAFMGLVAFLLYALPAALVRVAGSEQFVDGFNLREVIVAAVTWSYARAMLQCVVLFVLFILAFLVGKVVGVGSWLIVAFLGTGLLLWTTSVAAVYVVALAYGVRRNNVKNAR